MITITLPCPAALEKKNFQTVFNYCNLMIMITIPIPYKSNVILALLVHIGYVVNLNYCCCMRFFSFVAAYQKLLIWSLYLMMYTELELSFWALLASSIDTSLVSIWKCLTLYISILSVKIGDKCGTLFWNKICVHFSEWENVRTWVMIFESVWSAWEGKLTDHLLSKLTAVEPSIIWRYICHKINPISIELMIIQNS